MAGALFPKKLQLLKIQRDIECLDEGADVYEAKKEEMKEK